MPLNQKSNTHTDEERHKIVSPNQPNFTSWDSDAITHAN